MSDSVLVLVANKGYLPFAKKLFGNAIAAGNWKDDLLLITPDETVQPFKIDNRDVLVKHVRHIENDFSWSLYNPIVLNKLNIFEEDLKKWEHIVYLDCDITIQGDINALKKANCFSAIPYKTYRLNALFLNRKSSTYQELLDCFDLDVVPLNSGVMAFPSSILEKNTYDDIIKLYNKYKYVIHSDDEVINLFFYKKWKKLKITYNFDLQYFGKYLVKSRPPRIIHYIRSKEWQDRVDHGYGISTKQQDAIYELISNYFYVLYFINKNNLFLKKFKNSINKFIVNILKKSNYVMRTANELENLKNLHRFPPGHYHSPIPDANEIENHYASNPTAIEDIDFDFKNQKNILDDLLPFYSDIPWNFLDDSKNSRHRYKISQAAFRYSDAIFLHLMMRKYKPARIIAIGSGYSSAVMLDTNDLFFKDRKIELTLIDPSPQERLYGLITPTDKKTCRIYAEKVQNVDLTVFKELQAGDMLFVDSSHVSKAGSDFNFIVFKILPLLNKGVLIYFNNIFYPFEYPKEWLLKEKFFWNECYFLRAFLMNNKAYKIILFNSAAHKYDVEYLEKNMPEVLIEQEQCGGIWIQKQRENTLN